MSHTAANAQLRGRHALACRDGGDEIDDDLIRLAILGRAARYGVAEVASSRRLVAYATAQANVTGAMRRNSE
jgi:hypothetical protein